MTPVDIEAALEQPEFNNPLMDLAKAEIAALTGLQALESATDSRNELRWQAWTQDMAEMKADFFEDMAAPFGETVGHEDDPAEIIKNYYNGIKTRLLSPAYRLKQALEGAP